MHDTTPPLIIVHNAHEPRQTGLCTGVKSRDSYLKGRNTQDISSNPLTKGHHLIIHRIFGTKFFTPYLLDNHSTRHYNAVRGRPARLNRNDSNSSFTKPLFNLFSKASPRLHYEPAGAPFTRRSSQASAYSDYPLLLLVMRYRMLQST